VILAFNFGLFVADCINGVSKQTQSVCFVFINE
jgi:hypothetical protein